MDATIERPQAADEFLRVEARGIDGVPAGERHGRPRELAFLWAGAFVNYASLFTASLLTTYYGLGVWDGLQRERLSAMLPSYSLGDGYMVRITRSASSVTPAF